MIRLGLGQAECVAESRSRVSKVKVLINFVLLSRIIVVQEKKYFFWLGFVGFC